MALRQNIIYIYFKGKHQVTSKSQYQYNRKQYLYFADLNLPQVFEVHFSNRDKGESKTQIGNDKLVEIPDEYFWSGALQIYAWIYLHSGADDSETIYEIRIPLTKRAKPTDEEPLPVQQSAIDKAIAELNNAVNVTTENANKTESDKIIVANIKDEVVDLKEDIDSTATIINQKAQETIDASGRAETSALNAADSERKALNYSQQAEQSAQEALESKNIAKQKAEIATGASAEALGYRDEAVSARDIAVQAKQNIVDYRDETKGYRDETLNTKNDIQTLKGQIDETTEEIEDISDSVKEDAQSASQSASSANQSSINASQSASQAGQFADGAEQSANQAEQSMNTTKDYKNQSEIYKNQSETFKNQAEQFKNQSETNVSHYPKIVNDYWYVWDATNGEYINTNVDANGIKGDNGNGISSAVLNNDYTLTLTFTDGTTYTTPSIRGEKGEQGDPATSMEIHICSSSEYDSETRIPTIAQPDSKTFYLVPTSDATSPDLFTEWVYVNNAWEMFGSASVDLSGYLTDVTVDGTSVVTDGVANIPYAAYNKVGVVQVNASRGTAMSGSTISTFPVDSATVKAGTQSYQPITPAHQHESVFYGLAKASGDLTQASSDNAVGTYTNSAKSSIKTMLGVDTDLATKLDKPEGTVTTSILLNDFTVTTAQEEGWNSPHALSTAKSRIPKNARYIVTYNGTDYHLPCQLWGDNNHKVVEFLGNISLYANDTNGFNQTIYNVPFCIISDFDDANSIDVLTTTAETATFKITKIFNQTKTIDEEYLYGSADSPFKYYDNGTSTYSKFSIGNANLVTNRGGIAIGSNNKSTGDFAIATGYGTLASGAESFTEGSNTLASGYASHAGGDKTEASGYTSHAEGLRAKASGDASHAEGVDTEASGDASHVEGSDTIASGMEAHAEGWSTIASGMDSHTEGVGTIANHYAQHVFGTFNIADNSTADSDKNGNYIEIVGNGEEDESRSNARTLDWQGNERLKGSLTLGADTENETSITASELKKIKNINPIEDIQINGTSIIANEIANIPIASSGKKGIVQIQPNFGININSVGDLYINSATPGEYKNGSSMYKPVAPNNQHLSTFYGLAKASGDTTQASSDNPVGAYTEEAKTSIQTMLGLDNVVKNTDYASSSTAGVVKTDSDWGIGMYDPAWSGGDYGNFLYISPASSDQIKSGSTGYKAIVPSIQHEAVFYGLAKVSGDTTQSQSNNAVGNYTEDAKSAISDMLNGAVQVSGTDPTITAKSGIRYICGEVLSLNFTPSANGICDVMFTSGSTPTVLTLPNTVKMPEWFTIEANMTYEINIADGIYGAVTSWTL